MLKKKKKADIKLVFNSNVCVYYLLKPLLTLFGEKSKIFRRQD